MGVFFDEINRYIMLRLYLSLCCHLSFIKQPLWIFLLSTHTLLLLFLFKLSIISKLLKYLFHIDHYLFLEILFRFLVGVLEVLRLFEGPAERLVVEGSWARLAWLRKLWYKRILPLMWFIWFLSSREPSHMPHHPFTRFLLRYQHTRGTTYTLHLHLINNLLCFINLLQPFRRLLLIILFPTGTAISEAFTKIRIFLLFLESRFFG